MHGTGHKKSSLMQRQCPEKTNLMHGTGSGEKLLDAKVMSGENQPYAMDLVTRKAAYGKDNVGGKPILCNGPGHKKSCLMQRQCPEKTNLMQWTGSREKLLDAKIISGENQPYAMDLVRRQAA